MIGATPPRLTRGERGFALLLVLWTLVLLSLLVTNLTASARTEATIAANLRRNAEAEAAADGAIFHTIYQLMTAGAAARAYADGSTRRLDLPYGVVQVRIDNESGKLNPNTASQTLLATLLQNVGVGPANATSVAAAIVYWRSGQVELQAPGTGPAAYIAAGRDYSPPQTPFESVDEVGLVLGITPDLLARLRPYLSIYYRGDPDPVIAAPVVRSAIQAAADNGDPLLDTDPIPGIVVTVTASAVQPGGGRFTRRAVVQIAPASASGYQILAWETPGT